MSGGQCRHVKGPADGSASTADGAATLPLSTLPRMRCQSGQGGRLAAIERAQFGQFGQDAQRREGTDAGDGLEFLDALIQWGRLPLERLELGFDLCDVVLQPTDETLSLAA